MKTHLDLPNVSLFTTCFKKNQLVKCLLNSIEKTLFYCKLQIFCKSSAKIVNQKRCSGIVYTLKCISCNAIYFGKAKRYYYVKAAKLMGTSHLTKKKKTLKMLNISDHLLTCDCSINFDDFTILSKDYRENVLIALDNLSRQNYF